MDSTVKSSDYEQILTVDVIRFTKVRVTIPDVKPADPACITQNVIEVELDVARLAINWLQIANDMKTKGLSYNQQANAVGKQWSTYQRWLEGGDNEPRFGEGQALLILHSKVCGIGLTRQRLGEAQRIR